MGISSRVLAAVRFHLHVVVLVIRPAGAGGTGPAAELGRRCSVEPATLCTGAAERSFGKKAVFVREGGSIPIVAVFDKLLRAPVVLLGFGLADDNLHAPNEKLDLENFYAGIRTSAMLMEEIGRS